MRILLTLAAVAANLTAAPMSADRARLFRDAGLRQEEITAIAAGRPICGQIDSPDKSELLVHGAIYVDAPAEKFIEWYRNPANFIDGKSFLAARRFTANPSIKEFEDLVLDPSEIADLKKCKPRDCEIQLPLRAIGDFQTKLNWTAPDAPTQANVLLRSLAHEALLDYRTDGDRGLSVLQDKKTPIDISQSFRSIISRASALEKHFPDLYRYLTGFPQNRPPNTEDFFYWEKVKFGLKTTYRMNHVIIHRPQDRPNTWLIANKQLYASHYFQTALDVWVCLPIDDQKRGFHLVTLKAARVDGFTGLKGSAVRSVVTSRTKNGILSSLEKVKVQAESPR